MPRKKWKLPVRDMLDCIQRIQRYTQGFSYQSFIEDANTVEAVVHNFVILGEAAQHLLSDVEARHTENNWRVIVGLRNVAVHDYPNIRLEVVWDTVRNDLPPLSSLLKELLNTEEE